jgi:hypothetical protein
VTHVCQSLLSGGDRLRRGAARAEDAQGTPTQSHVSPIILVYEDSGFPLGLNPESNKKIKSSNLDPKPRTPKPHPSFHQRYLHLHRHVQRLRGGLVFKAHRLCVSLNSRPESNKEEKEDGQEAVATPCRFHLQALKIDRLGFNQNYYTFTSMSLIRIVLCSRFA